MFEPSIRINKSKKNIQIKKSFDFNDWSRKLRSTSTWFKDRISQSTDWSKGKYVNITKNRINYHQYLMIKKKDIIENNEKEQLVNVDDDNNDSVNNNGEGVISENVTTHKESYARRSLKSFLDFSPQPVKQSGDTMVPLKPSAGWIPWTKSSTTDSHENIAKATSSPFLKLKSNQVASSSSLSVAATTGSAHYELSPPDSNSVSDVSSNLKQQLKQVDEKIIKNNKKLKPQNNQIQQQKQQQQTNKKNKQKSKKASQNDQYAQMEKAETALTPLGLNDQQHSHKSPLLQQQEEHDSFPETAKEDKANDEAEGDEEELEFELDELCSSVAVDFVSWLEKCPLVLTGKFSILHFIDAAAQEELTAALVRDRTIPPPIRGPLLKRATDRIQNDFTVGLFDELDISMLLFEKVLGLSRSDILFSRKSMMSSSYEGPISSLRNEFIPFSEDWEGSEKRLDLMHWLQMRGAPILYHMRLFEVAKLVHQLQVAKHIGAQNDIEFALSIFKPQIRDFTTCYENLRDLSPARFETNSQSGGGNGKKFYQCPEDLYISNSARKACTAEIRSFDAERVKDEREKATKLDH